MHVARHGNLTIELIRHDRFGVDSSLRLGRCHDALHADRREQADRPERLHRPCLDRVLLSPQALLLDAWTRDSACQPNAERVLCEEPERFPLARSLGPRTITPVMGSPALAGLGVALVVPGTLLDVVA